MRCSVCDFSQGEAQSLYNIGLKEYKGARNRYVFYDRYRQEEICSVCYTPPTFIKKV